MLGSRVFHCNAVFVGGSQATSATATMFIMQMQMLMRIQTGVALDVVGLDTARCNVFTQGTNNAQGG